ncbi:hypothetical protein FRC06_011183 [Ceratobasidium sp. 370]|nr:hypothetical protein FRC06_011183 [Ceratobasidium sp. 370]
MEHCQLFIGHAKAGFCVWRSPRDFERIPYDMDKTTFLLSYSGSAAFSPDGGFIAIATLDHSVVVYPLSQNGPLIHQQQVIQNKEHGGSQPIIPVALVSNNLVLRGSTSGKIPIINLQSSPLAPIENGSQEVIRVLAPYGDKVVVGLSDTHRPTIKLSWITTSLSSKLPLVNWKSKAESIARRIRRA